MRSFGPDLKCLNFSSLHFQHLYRDVTDCMVLSYEDIRVQLLKDSLVKIPSRMQEILQLLIWGRLYER